jgi:hypothetical protein
MGPPAATPVLRSADTGDLAEIVTISQIDLQDERREGEKY